MNWDRKVYCFQAQESRRPSPSPRLPGWMFCDAMSHSDSQMTFSVWLGGQGSWGPEKPASWPCVCLLAAVSVKGCCTLSLRFLWGDVGFSWQAELQATQRNVSGSTALGGARRLHFQAKGNTASDSRPRLGRDCEACWIQERALSHPLLTQTHSSPLKVTGGYSDSRNLVYPLHTTIAWGK